MTIEALIDAAIDKGHTISYAWADDFILRVSYGDDLGCCELKLCLLNQWIGILEDYKVENFGDNGSITPDYPCATLNEVNLLIGKINALAC